VQMQVRSKYTSAREPIQVISCTERCQRGNRNKECISSSSGAYQIEKSTGGANRGRQASNKPVGPGLGEVSMPLDPTNGVYLNRGAAWVVLNK
jgi:hypothetical protein